ncbi:hypothetical protein [Wansuia hejianensis]|uniref:Uncharacterized protein n=1 Tax=Wansuia hejianensis TaxID=2763667 RepID=A0A926IM93_9FIRM|nr:hypothetical protein [Wansuia hejianensis]MBC8590190.1 hypothetical protein [Wansuia hejianensis]
MTVEVKFSQPVDKADATTTSPYKVNISGVTLTNPKLSADGKTLTLTAEDANTAGAAIDVEDATVVVEPIKSKDDAKVKSEKYVGLMTYKDEVDPEILNVKATTNGTIAEAATIELTEPVKSGVLVKVNGSYATVTPFAGANSDKLELTGLKLETGKTHTVEVINAEDVAGNKVVSMSASFTVAVDNVRPVATVTAGGNDKEILVTFNKEMNPAKVTGITVKDETLSPVTVDPAAPVANTDNKQFTIKVTQVNIYENKDSRIFSVVLPKDMEDTLGNKTVDTVLTVTLTKDTVKPVATGYNVVKDSDDKVESIEISFSEGLKAGSPATGQTLDQVTSSIVKSNGVLADTTFNMFKAKEVKAGDKKVVFTADSAQDIIGEYAFSFAKDLVTDQSEAGNKSAAFNYTINFGDAKADTEFEVSTAIGGTNVITVTFDEGVKGGAVAGSATDLANYTLGGKPLPEGTTITLDGTQKEAVITLPKGSIEKTDPAVVFTVANVKNLNGTKTLKSYSATVELEDNTAPTVVEAPVHNATAKTISYKFNEEIQLVNQADSTVVAANMIENQLAVYKVEDGAYDNTLPNVVKAVVWDADTNTLTVTYTDTLEAGDYIVDAWGYSITDLEGNRIANLDDATNYLVTVK